MKITRNHLRRLIKEEMSRTLNEQQRSGYGVHGKWKKDLIRHRVAEKESGDMTNRINYIKSTLQGIFHPDESTAESGQWLEDHDGNVDRLMNLVAAESRFGPNFNNEDASPLGKNLAFWKRQLGSDANGGSLIDWVCRVLPPSTQLTSDGKEYWKNALVGCKGDRHLEEGPSTDQMSEAWQQILGNLLD